MLYFAYASNLSKDYMLSRCPHALPIKKVRLKDHKLTFNQLGDIIESEGSYVYGAIYMISKENLRQLDLLEGYPTLYERKIVEVKDDFGNHYDAIAYYMPEKEKESPPEHYVSLLRDGLKDWDIPRDYLEASLKE